LVVLLAVGLLNVLAASLPIFLLVGTPITSSPLRWQHDQHS
jgi:hypothetical protein